MKTSWESRGTATNVRDAVLFLSGLAEDELTHPKATRPEEIENLTAAAALVKSAVSTQTSVTVVGDYDADGVCSAAILFLLLKELGCPTPAIKIPKRLSQGYGLHPEIIDEVTEGLLITVDNGISACEAVKKAKEKGLQVIIIDHHLPGAVIPDADIIVNPHLNPANNRYVDYCGAGLAFKLAEFMIPQARELLRKLLSMAAIATIADIVPLTGDNRLIVREGLESLNGRNVTQGLCSLLQECDMMTIREEDISYKIAPILNAIGRLQDDGAIYACGCLAQDEKPAPGLSQKLIAVNQQRKSMVNEQYELITEDIRANGHSAPVILVCPELHEGIAGIIAGKLAEDYKVPSFVLTESNGKLKGSGRSSGSIHLKDLMDTHIHNAKIQYGGHAGAVGVSMPSSELAYFKDAMEGALAGYMFSESAGVLYYDVTISADEVLTAIRDLDVYGPYGEAVPRPVFLVRGIKLIEKKGEYYFFRGAEQTHISMAAQEFSLIGFHLAERYKDLGCPLEIDVVGELEINESQYGTVPQVRILDLRAAN